MALSDKQSRQALILNFLYSLSSSIARENMLYARPSGGFTPTATVEGVSARKGLVIPSPSEPLGKIEMYSPSFYATCTFGGILSCGLTHHSHLSAFVDQPNSLSLCNHSLSTTRLSSDRTRVPAGLPAQSATPAMCCCNGARERGRVSPGLRSKRSSMSHLRQPKLGRL